MLNENLCSFHQQQQLQKLSFPFAFSFNVEKKRLRNHKSALQITIAFNNLINNFSCRSAELYHCIADDSS